MYVGSNLEYASKHQMVQVFEQVENIFTCVDVFFKKRS